MRTFSVRQHQYDMELQGDGRQKQLWKPDRGTDSYCFAVTAQNKSRGKKLFGATHVPSAAFDDIEDQIVGWLIRAFETWGADAIPDHFDIPQGLPAYDPVIHKCQWFSGATTEG